MLEAQLEDLRLGWDSPVKEVVHPQYVHLESRGGLGWLEGFSEWVVRCGLEFAGAPGKDKFITNTGDEAEMPGEDAHHEHGDDGAGARRQSATDVQKSRLDINLHCADVPRGS